MTRLIDPDDARLFTREGIEQMVRSGYAIMPRVLKIGRWRLSVWKDAR